MLVIEGPDGAGKTTLAEKLHEDLHLPVLAKAVNSAGTPMVDLKGWVDQEIRRMRRMKFEAIPHIYDRFALISEPIYGPVLRQGFEGDRESFADLDWLSGSLLEFYSLRPVIICALPPWPVVYHNISKTEQPTLVVENWKQVYWGYHCWVAHHRRAITVWDYTADDYNDLVNEVEHRLRSDWHWSNTGAHV